MGKTFSQSHTVKLKIKTGPPCLRSWAYLLHIHRREAGTWGDIRGHTDEPFSLPLRSTFLDQTDITQGTGA